MSPIFLVAVQLLQAFNLYTVVQTFIIAVLAAIVLFIALRFFGGK